MMPIPRVVQNMPILCGFIFRMGTEQFCLRWNDFHSNITAAFSEIRDEDDFFDVTLVSVFYTYLHTLALSFGAGESPVYHSVNKPSLQTHLCQHGQE